jgi:hypothetical protein
MPPICSVRSRTRGNACAPNRYSPTHTAAHARICVATKSSNKDILYYKGFFVKGHLEATGPSALLPPNREPVSQLIGGPKILWQVSIANIGMAAAAVF